MSIIKKIKKIIRNKKWIKINKIQKKQTSLRTKITTIVRIKTTSSVKTDNKDLKSTMDSLERWFKTFQNNLDFHN